MRHPWNILLKCMELRWHLKGQRIPGQDIISLCGGGIFLLFHVKNRYDLTNKQLLLFFSDLSGIFIRLHQPLFEPWEK